MRVTEQIARQMPDLGLPRMSEKVRNAFKDILNYEHPLGNGSVKNILTLAQAHGYCSHPCDWVPSSEGGHQFPKIYEPWAVWLANNRYTPFYVGVPLTAENWDAWKPGPLRKAFRPLRRIDRAAGGALLMTVGAIKPVTVRLALQQQIGSGAMFHGLYPDDVPIMQHLLDDQSESVRNEATRKLDEVKGLETKEDHAKAIAKYFRVKGKGVLSSLRREPSDPKVLISPKIHKDPVMRHCFSTDLDALVDVLGITAKDFTSSFDLEHFDGNVFSLSMRTKDIEARKILARRVAEAGKECPAGLFLDVEPETWNKALEVNLRSVHHWSIFEFLGMKAGNLDCSLVQKTNSYKYMVPSILQEIKTGDIPINIQHDPLRNVALIASKDAAAELLEEALAAGIAECNPRLTMLKYNLAL